MINNENVLIVVQESKVPGERFITLNSEVDI